MHKCNTGTCKNYVRKKGGSCNTCKSRSYRKKNPVRYAYQALKDNAKRRKKVFSISYEEFKSFCYAYDYIVGKGRRKESYTVDRIDNTKGYTVDNIRVITNSENAKKGCKRLHTEYDNYEKRLVCTVVDVSLNSEHSDDDPF
jgi:hypothetical protein